MHDLIELSIFEIVDLEHDHRLPRGMQKIHVLIPPLISTEENLSFKTLVLARCETPCYEHAMLVWTDKNLIVMRPKQNLRV